MEIQNYPAIQVEKIFKSFDQVEAVSGIDFDVNQGEIFGFLGPNGAGKTTTINMLTGLARPDAGTIHINGINCTQKTKAAQHLIGTVPDESNLYPELTGFENLSFCASLYGIKKKSREEKARELLELFGLTKAANRKFAGYSKGMKRKLTIAAGIIHNPPILFLDEPTTGIDVASARQLRQIIADLHKAGTTIFLTTHYIEEAERLCDRIAFIVSGRIIRIDTVANLMQPVKGNHILRIACSAGIRELASELQNNFSFKKILIPETGILRIEDTSPVSVGPVIRFLEEKGIEVFEAVRIRPSLEEVFVDITGIKADMMKKEKGKG
ncbi:MAG: ABC transporter ATP-binding protein [Fidelibacterota bacterium]